MKNFLRTIVLFPLALGMMLAVLRRALAGWKYADVLVWCLFLSLMAAFWIPAILLPYVRRNHGNR